MHKFFLFLFIVFIPFSVVNAQCLPDENSVCYYLMRHAEKLNDGTADPSLSPDGLKRSIHLSEILLDKGITAIYSTPFNRTKETVMPLAREIGVDIEEYDFRKLNDHIEKWYESHKGQSIVIVGHSNTTPFLVNLVMGSDTLKQLNENAYGDLFILKSQSPGKAELSVSDF
ncbi:SixA phosphatase family protein [Balneola sp. MJW-20]|uniref:SixA phosphatase family protein n=1 Tax=Gracilimonas aurantiaca TaxID=3234185 RepID=UPI003465F0D6